MLKLNPEDHYNLIGLKMIKVSKLLEVPELIEVEDKIKYRSNKNNHKKRKMLKIEHLRKIKIWWLKIVTLKWIPKYIINKRIQKILELMWYQICLEE